MGNEIVDTLANEGMLKEKPSNTPHIHLAHASPYWLASCPTATHDGAIRNIHKFIIKAHDNREVANAQNKSPYVEKWLTNKQINQKLSNHLWKIKEITDAQITPTLKFRYAQYMGNHRKNIFSPLKFQNPNCTLCHKNDRDTWPHLLSMCEHLYPKGLRIARHNKAVHLITHTLQANKHTQYYTLTNACNFINMNQEQTVPEWLIGCTCPQTSCQCQARLRLDILCILGAPNHTPTPLLPSHTHTHTIQVIEFTYCHDRFPEQALTQKHAKYDSLINTIRNEPPYHYKARTIKPPFYWQSTFSPTLFDLDCLYGLCYKWREVVDNTCFNKSAHKHMHFFLGVVVNIWFSKFEMSMQ